MTADRRAHSESILDAPLFQPHGRTDSLLRTAWFELRATGLRLVRHAKNWGEHLLVPRAAMAPLRPNEWHAILGRSVSPLWTAQSEAEKKLIEGKVENLCVAAARLDGKVFAAGEIFSFWKIVGPPRREHGFVVGRELREGCLIPSVGGGLCQMSNALHLAALEAGMEIVERHPHTRVVPGSIAEAGRDATVFWNYKDLRFRSSVPFILDVKVDVTDLLVQMRGEFSPARKTGPAAPSSSNATLDEAEDCLECGHRECIHHPDSNSEN